MESAYVNQNKNPIFIEWYSHLDCECYKINLPWSKYRKHTLVLCEVSKGYEHAKELARQSILNYFDLAATEKIG